VKTIEEALRISLPVVAEALAAKATRPTPPKDSKQEAPLTRSLQEPAVVHDKVVTWHS
jgi:hypothetical protein